MTNKYIKNFSAEYKTKVVLELLESEVTIRNCQRNMRLHQRLSKIGKSSF